MILARKLASLILYTHDKSKMIINKRLKVNAIKEIKHLFKQSLISMYVCVYVCVYIYIDVHKNKYMYMYIFILP